MFRFVLASYLGFCQRQAEGRYEHFQSFKNGLHIWISSWKNLPDPSCSLNFPTFLLVSFPDPRVRFLHQFFFLLGSNPQPAILIKFFYRLLLKSIPVQRVRFLQSFWRLKHFLGSKNLVITQNMGTNHDPER